MTTIYKNFKALSKEKQERIINAACSEFGRYGYKKTSAEQIAQKADIAKGMVFHYFRSKLGLYEYLAEYTYHFLEEWFGGLEDKIKDLDFVEQYRYMTKTKLQAYTSQPQVFEFYTMLFMNPENMHHSEKVKMYYEKAMALRANAFHLMQTSDNTKEFSDNFNKEKTKKYITWMIEGYAGQLLAQINSQPLADLEMDGYWIEFDEILDDMKKIFYKGGAF